MRKINLRDVPADGFVNVAGFDALCNGNIPLSLTNYTSGLTRSSDSVDSMIHD